ncbi:hypothetical protein NMY22_g16640 [Coprinellus aureogranulatus]|nr:hypothetical protein NMY22_g16640 [Coprinellus aureogranulatus]
MLWRIVAADGTTVFTDPLHTAQYRLLVLSAPPVPPQPLLRKIRFMLNVEPAKVEPLRDLFTNQFSDHHTDSVLKVTAWKIIDPSQLPELRFKSNTQWGPPLLVPMPNVHPPNSSPSSHYTIWKPFLRRSRLFIGPAHTLSYPKAFATTQPSDLLSLQAPRRSPGPVWWPIFDNSLLRSTTSCPDNRWFLRYPFGLDSGLPLRTRSAECLPIGLDAMWHGKAGYFVPIVTRFGADDRTQADTWNPSVNDPVKRHPGSSVIEEASSSLSLLPSPSTIDHRIPSGAVPVPRPSRPTRLLCVLSAQRRPDYTRRFCLALQHQQKLRRMVLYAIIGITILGPSFHPFCLIPTPVLWSGATILPERLPYDTMQATQVPYCPVYGQHIGSMVGLKRSMGIWIAFKGAGVPQNEVLGAVAHDRSDASTSEDAFTICSSRRAIGRLSAVDGGLRDAPCGGTEERGTGSEAREDSKREMAARKGNGKVYCLVGRTEVRCIGVPEMANFLQRCGPWPSTGDRERPPALLQKRLAGDGGDGQRSKQQTADQHDPGNRREIWKSTYDVDGDNVGSETREAVTGTPLLYRCCAPTCWREHDWNGVEDGYLCQFP